MKANSKRNGKDATLAVAEAAERLFEQIGFQKTTVVDIARELHMSPANVYRFYAAKSEINEAVGRKLLGEIEAALTNIVKQPTSAKEKLRACIQMVGRSHSERFVTNRKLHELLATAFSENWPIVRNHFRALDEALSTTISQGKSDGELQVDDCDLAAVLVRNACLPFCHPVLIVEGAQDETPTLDQMIDFCIAALSAAPCNMGAAAILRPVNPSESR